jgi:hypothetical protein
LIELALYLELASAGPTKEVFFFFFPSFFFSSRHIPTVSVEGASIRVADPKARENCLKGYTFVLESVHLVFVFKSSVLTLKVNLSIIISSCWFYCYSEY